MTTHKRFIAPAALAALFFMACGGTSKPARTAADVAGGPATPTEGKAGTAAVLQAAAPVKPLRALSADSKQEFSKLSKAYLAAKKSGLANECRSLAGRFEDLWSKDAKLVEAKFNQGAILLECGKVEAAEKAFKELLAKQPNHPGATNNLGYIAWQRGKMGEALELFKKAATNKSSEGYSNLAMDGRNRGLENSGSERKNVLQAALGNVRRALAVDSSNINAYEVQAAIVVDHAKNAAKLEIARLITLQASKREPGYAPLYNLMGLTLLKMGEVTRALGQFRKAVALDNSLLEAHMNIGAITLSFRDYASAAKSFVTVLESKPTDRKMLLDATVGLGVAYRGQRKFDDALTRYQEAQKLAPNDDSIAYNIGILHQDYRFDASSPAAAIKTLRTAQSFLERYAASSTNREQRADAKRRLKNIREMIPMLLEQQKMVAGLKQAPAAPKSK